MNKTHKIFLSVLIGASLLLSSLARAQNIEVTADTRFVEAMDDYQVGKWAKAYERFIVLADNHSAEAARVTLLMHRFGPKLYGATFDASREQVERWERTASQQWSNRSF